MILKTIWTMGNKVNLSEEIRKKLFERDNYSCQKCGFQDKTTEELEPHHIVLRVNCGNGEIQNLITLCSICHHYAPDSEEELKRYLAEKIDGKILETFRKSNRSISKQTKTGMLNLFNKGKLITRAPLGYKIINKELIPAENSFIVQEIYQNFLNSDTSLTQIGKKYNLSVNGLKKVLTNQTYLGKVKFAGQVAQGTHKPLLSEELFNNVQEKLKNDN